MAVQPVLLEKDVEAFYSSALESLEESGVPFLVAGAYALWEHTGIFRETKDLDIFCRPGDYPELLQSLASAGLRTEVTDANWIAKAFEGDHFVDLIFGARNAAWTVDSGWLDRAKPLQIFGRQVRVLGPEDLISSKLYIQDRYRYDGADVNHLILKQGDALDWESVLRRMDRDWELLFSSILNFSWIYPSEREKVPDWLRQELTSRLSRSTTLPVPQDPVCRGPLVSLHQYDIDIQEWGYKEK